LISDSIVLNSVVPLKSNRVSILDSVKASDRSRSYWKADSSLVSLLNRVSSIANAVTCSDLDLDEVSRSNVVLSKLLSTERARVFVNSLSTKVVGEASYCAVDVAAREDNPLVIIASVGSPVTQYEVYMRTQSVNNFGNNNQWIVLPSCNINSTVTGFTNNFGGQGVYKYSCSFSRQQLAQYNIASTDFIQVQVRARNSVGYGAYSVQQAN
jgi:hypothetical protein